MDQKLIDEVADKAVAEGMTLKTLEWLNQPLCMGDLLCRIQGPVAFEKLINDGCAAGMADYLHDPRVEHARNIISKERVYLAIREKLGGEPAKKA